MNKTFACLLIFLAATIEMSGRSDTLRVLAIGNSFSEDAVEQNLSEIARADGNCVIIGNLYIPGCSLEKHWDNAVNDRHAYAYRHIDARGNRTETKSFSIAEALADERWDAVSIQQSSPLSGKWNSFEPYMGELLAYLRDRIGEQTRVMFHQTWAYSLNSTHPKFGVYGNDSRVMFDSIAVASERAVRTYGLEVIPSGAAIENARRTSIRDNFFRDGYHLSHACGRYLAACTWYESLFRRSSRGIVYRPAHVTAEQALICQSAASAATDKPFGVSKIGFRKPAGNYDRERVPRYQLPDPLLMQDGRTKVKSVRKWEGSRRGELLELFESQMYGRAPEPGYERFEVIECKEDALGGLATRKRVVIFLDPKEKVRIDLLIYLPNGGICSGVRRMGNINRSSSGGTGSGKQRVPVFLGINFFGNNSITTETDIPEPDAADLKRYGDYERVGRGQYAYRWPLKLILSSGYALATFYRGDADPDYDDSSTRGVQSLFPNGSGKVCAPDEWGSIAAWAWGLSRAMDYLETDKDIDSERVALVGHSRLAKAALWAAATDRRFAMVAANESGCGGAAISRRCFGETVGIINRSFPHWFCDNFKQYGENEAALPFDQHELIALIAPRPIIIGSARADLWSDPEGEWEGLQEALPVYRLYGAEDRTAYHIREGKHEILEEDWKAYLEFADRQL